MFQRSITEKDVRLILETGETIEDYPKDNPYPSRLILGWVESRPIHLVVAENIDEDVIFVITAYQPEPDQWEFGFKRRKL